MVHSTNFSSSANLD